MFKKLLVPLLLVSILPSTSCFFAASASAETGSPSWRLIAVSNPTNLISGNSSGANALVVEAVNVGGGSTNGGEITIGETVPDGLTAVAIDGVNAYRAPSAYPVLPSLYSKEPGAPSCTLAPTPHCTFAGRIDPGDTLLMEVMVNIAEDPPASCAVAAGAKSCVASTATVTGGGVASATTEDQVTVSSAQPEYGIAKGGLVAATSTRQAGAHPNVTTDFFLNTIFGPNGKPPNEPEEGDSIPVGEPKDVFFDLPPGLVGTTVGMPRCTMAQVGNEGECPRNTMVGTSTILFSANGVGRTLLTVPVFNIAPAPGEPAAFGFDAVFFPVRLDTSVLSNGEYNVRVTAPDITQGAETLASSVTIWGVPAEHNEPGPDDAARNLAASRYLGKGKSEYSFGGSDAEHTVTELGNPRFVTDEARVPLLTNPSQCSDSLSAVLETDSWEGADPGVLTGGQASMGTDTGCDQLPFDPSISMLPDRLEAGAPAGYSFDLKLPQNDEPEGLATPDVKRTSVTLPLGTVISPSAADGLGDCSDAQFELHSGVVGNCPRDSQVGVVRVKTPALEERLSGEVFLGSPECEPCSPADAQGGKMVRLFLQFSSEGEDGIIVKLEGRGEINQQTGQITTVFENTPQLPFSELQLILTGGERATLANPRSCGTATTTSDLTPWSTPYTPDATPSSSFEVNENCFGPRFSPSFTAGTTSNQAGGFSPFTLSFGREDADQFLNGVQLQMPPGLLGMISRVKLCGEPQAAEGTCGAESQIGEVSVETGPGADPFLVTGGKVYITGPYKGAPYGLSIVVPAKAGPYTLSGTTGKGTVVVRSAISVNPSNAALTVTSDPLPTELDGIPLQLKRVNVTVGTNNNFTFNPTSCEKMEIKGTLTSVANATANPSSSFQVTNCAGLKFKPSFSAQTNAKTSKADGASLLFKLAYPANAVTSEAWFSKMKFDIPKQLPARLTTIQKACVAKVFEANPAACPAASNIGRAIVHTSILPVPVEGPVYFVSYGGQKFPEVVLVLQGDGVTVDLHGETNISKAGVTSAVFRSVPDVPFETAEVYVPTGPFSEFTALGNVCTQSLTMPVAFTPQNGGTEIHQDTRIGVAGCPKVKAAKKKKKAGAAARARRSSVRERGGRS
jgi:hypothetical protein